MGFWDKARDVAKSAGKVAWEQTKAANERVQQYKDEMPSLNDRELARIVAKERSSSPLKASAARQELKNRGYSTTEEIKSLL
ncbi:hypothetical protein IB428_004641 [Salmonella enterica]|nr:hypothetical protein [Salmonella enterica]EGI0858266.1 hypothetical protein [Salmonella enterica]EGM1409668.1 hypothetical protein [Salmonella enterica]